ncbi:MAG: hypothetical protein Q8O82_13130 [Pseudorhodobacter sp.]|nr:hypothetical protein [Pseudorhodobacter sp.]
MAGERPNRRCGCRKGFGEAAGQIVTPHLRARSDQRIAVEGERRLRHATRLRRTRRHKPREGGAAQQCEDPASPDRRNTARVRKCFSVHHHSPHATRITAIMALREQRGEARFYPPDIDAEDAGHIPQDTIITDALHFGAIPTPVACDFDLLHRDILSTLSENPGVASAGWLPQTGLGGFRKRKPGSHPWSLLTL